MNTNEQKKEKLPGRGLIDFVFSWSLEDVLKEDYYKGQVKMIPLTFSSKREYMNSFRIPLIEETHADLLSSMSMPSRLPTCRICSVKQSKKCKQPKDFFYKIELAREKAFKNGNGTYEPLVGDLIALTDVRPKCINDFDRPTRPYLVAYVHRVQEQYNFVLSILSSKPMSFEQQKIKNRETLFAVCLINMTTNIRIWDALHGNLKGGNLSIIQEVLQAKSGDAENCTTDLSEKNCGAAFEDVKARILSSGLNSSQKEAVLRCLVTRECNKQSTVKLIWGPPGTGKTKTVGLLLFSLLRMNCRTLTCAPTNTAVLEVTQRLLKNVVESPESDIFGLGDIVLFGNGKRMKISDHHDLLDVFLDNRVDILSNCFASSSGWKSTLESMIFLLQDPQGQYRWYLKDRESKDREEKKQNRWSVNEGVSRNQGKEIDGQSSKDNKRDKILEKFIVEALNENKNKKTRKEKEPSHKEKTAKHEAKESGDGSRKEEKNKEQVVDNCDDPLTFEEFVQMKFNSIAVRLKYYLANLRKHLPTSFISLEVAQQMKKALDLLESYEALLHTSSGADKGLKQVFRGKLGSRQDSLQKPSIVRQQCLNILRSLPKKFSFAKKLACRREMKEFCLANACLIFCTVSSTAKLHVAKMTPLELLVIDEAAQLKECEATIPLQLPGLRHAILVGDEQQLPAMVKSKVAEEAEFGRSLFQRLALVGHGKDLLNVQHRMHPSISSYPNSEFYDNKILDGYNVQERSYRRSYLQGKMYNPYSFINVEHGEEELDDSHSQKNMVEAAVVAQIVARLFKESERTNLKVKVGIISPYKAQVNVIGEKVKNYGKDSTSNFSVSVRSVDGFQGGEEDVILISTVRCNTRGEVGFLSNRQRANVALTRARHCLWIVGSGATLCKSGSVWREVVIDAKIRGCFFNAYEDGTLSQAITAALVEKNQLDILLSNDSFLFRQTRWKVLFSGGFLQSMSRIKNHNLCREVLSLLESLANGCRRVDRKKNLYVHQGISSALINQYKVDQSLILVWSVDILRENSHHIQVLKIWDILALPGMKKLAEGLDNLFGSYTVDKINCCKHKCLDGNLVVPMRWPIDPSGHPKASAVQSLSEQIASLSLRGEPETSSSAYRTNSNLTYGWRAKLRDHE